MVSPDSAGTACPLSGRNSTYRPVQISATGSVIELARKANVGISTVQRIESDRAQAKISRRIVALLKLA
jgi:hypothetical protein